jgi:hypothetical protein
LAANTRVLYLTGLFAAILSVVAVAPAGAQTQSQGFRATVISTLTGTRAYISGNSNHTNSAGWMAAMVAVQNGAGTTGFQMGQEKQTTTSDDCGSHGSTTFIFIEYVYQGQYTCPKQTEISGGFGTGELYAVALSSGGWEGFWNSNLFYGPINLGLPTGYGIARAEISRLSTGPTYNMTWGPTGTTKWEYKTGTGNYVEVGTSSGTSIPAGDWHLGGTPSPFNLSYMGP